MTKKNIYLKIINPATGRQVNVNGRIGREILRNYLSMLKGGSMVKPTKPSMTIQNALTILKKLSQCEQKTMAGFTSCGVLPNQISQLLEFFKEIKNKISPNQNKNEKYKLVYKLVYKLLGELETIFNNFTKKLPGGSNKKNIINMVV